MGEGKGSCLGECMGAFKDSGNILCLNSGWCMFHYYLVYTYAIYSFVCIHIVCLCVLHNENNQIIV